MGVHYTEGNYVRIKDEIGWETKKAFCALINKTNTGNMTVS